MESSVEQLVYKATEKALAEISVGTDADSAADTVRFSVEWPVDMGHGDYAVNAAMAAAKQLGKNPRELASELAPLIQANLGMLASRVEVAGPGFINITLSLLAVSEHIALAADSELAKTWGMSDTKAGKRIIIEFSCPNPFKEMHIGHLMSTIIGESIARITESAGATVCRDSYGGDVGPHVAKALWALQKNIPAESALLGDAAVNLMTAEEIGAAYAEGSKAYEENPEAKEEIDALNTAIYKVIEKEESVLSSDERSLLEMWRVGREISLEAFRDIYRLLNTHFDYYFFESETAPIGMEVVQDGVTRGVFEESDGAIIFNGEKRGKEAGLHTLVFITSRGTPTYEAKDVGLAFLKEQRWPSDESIIITAAEQVGHFKVFLAALSEIAPLVAAKTHHVPHGFLRLTTGKMSSREGNVVTAMSLIRDVIEKVLERNEDPLIAEQVAMGAIKYMILRSSPGSDIIFDFEKSLSLEGDSGPYLQYALVRAKSVIKQSQTISAQGLRGTIIPENATPAEPYRIERLIIRFPEVVATTQKNLAPHTIVQYLTQLAGEWNSFYAAERIVGGAHEAYKLRIAAAFVATMETGLALLGIPVPEKM